MSRVSGVMDFPAGYVAPGQPNGLVPHPYRALPFILESEFQ